MKISENTEQDKVLLNFSKLDRQNGQWALKKVDYHLTWEFIQEDSAQGKGSNRLIRHLRHLIKQRLIERLRGRIKSVTILSEV